MKKLLTIIILLATLLPSILVAQTQTSVPFGGTGRGTFPLGSLLVGNGTGGLLSTTSPTVGYITATNTTATSTFSGGLSSLLYNLFGATNFSVAPTSNADATASNELPRLGQVVTLTGDQTINGTKTFTQFPQTSGTPTSTNQYTNKGYVDTLFTTGSRFVNSATVATTAALPSTAAIIYDNGTSGVGATLTRGENGALGSIDTVAVINGNTILVKDQAVPAQNGYYDITSVGSAGAPYVLTRNAEYDEQAEIETGTFFNVINGDDNANKQFNMNTNSTITVGTTAINFALLSASNVYTASQGIALSGFNFVLNLLFNGGLGITGGQVFVDTDDSTIDLPTNASNKIRVKDLGITAAKIANGAISLTGTKIAGILGIANGGTGVSTTPTNGQLLIGNGTGYSLGTLTAGDNVTITNTAGGIEIDATGGGGASATTSLGSTITTVTFISTPQTAQTWTNMPPTETEIFNATSSTANNFTRQRIDLTRGETFQLSGRQAVAGTAGATLKMQCSSDQTTWTDAGASSGSIDIGVLGTQPRVGNLASLNSACKGYVYLRLVGTGGNDVNDPSWRSLKADIYLTRPSVGGTATSTTEVSVGATPQTAQTWTNMPAALTEIFGATNARFFRDTTNATGYRLVVNQSVAGASGADLNLQCSTDNVTFIAADTGGAGEVDIGTGTGVKNGDEASLSSGCIGSRYWRLVGKQGNAVADPAFRQIKVLFTYVEDATGGSGSNWSFDTTFGQLSLTPSSTIPVWIKDTLFASSSVYFQGLTNFATTTIGNQTNFFEIKEQSIIGGLIRVPMLFGKALGTIVGDITGVPINHQAIIVEDTTLNENPALQILSSNGDSASVSLATSTGSLEISGTNLNFFNVVGATTTLNGAIINNGTTLKFAGYSSSPQLVAADNQTGLHFDGPGILSFHNSGSQSALFNGSGNFGLGSSSPSKKLSVIGDSYFKGVTSNPFRLEAPSNISNLNVQFRDLSSIGIGTAPIIQGQFSNGLFGSGFDQTVAIFGQSDIFNPNIVFYNSDLTGLGQLVYGTTTDSLNLSGFSGGVGIGTSTPSAEFAVQGNTYLKGSSEIPLIIENSTASTTRCSFEGREFLSAVTGMNLSCVASNGSYGTGVDQELAIFGRSSSSFPQLSFAADWTNLSAGTGVIRYASTSDEIQVTSAVGGFRTYTANNLTNSIRLTQTSLTGGLGTLDFPYIEFNTPGGILSNNVGGFWGGFAILENPSFDSNPVISFLSADISDTGNAATFEYATTSQTLITSKQFKIRDANDDIILTFQNDAEDADANIEYDELTDILKIQGASTSLSVFPQVGADPMCWDGSGESVIGDCTSLAKYKTNIKSLDSGLADILALSPRIFNWKDDMREDVGFIAEEIEAVNPKLAKYTDGELSGYKERAIVASLVNAVKDQQTQIENLKGGVVQVKETATDKWQWLAIILLFIFIGVQQIQIIRLRK